MAATHLDVGLRCVKYLLCAVNSLFVLTGIMIISIGSTIFAVYEDFSWFLDPSYFSPASLLVGVGVLIFVIAFFGCWGAFKESTCMVLVFAVSLSIVLILELAAAIAAYALQDGIKDLLASRINATMQEYSTNEEAVAAVDFMQSRLHCCGYNGYEDWNITPVKFEGEVYFPESCCAWISHEANQTSCTPFQEGCLSRLSLIVNRSALYIATGAIAIALIQLTGIMFACVLGKAIRRQKTQRELRRWELRQSLVNGYQPLEKTMSFPVTCVQSPEYPLQGI